MRKDSTFFISGCIACSLSDPRECTKCNATAHFQPDVKDLRSSLPSVSLRCESGSPPALPCTPFSPCTLCLPQHPQTPPFQNNKIPQCVCDSTSWPVPDETISEIQAREGRWRNQNQSIFSVPAERKVTVGRARAACHCAQPHTRMHAHTPPPSQCIPLDSCIAPSTKVPGCVRATPVPCDGEDPRWCATCNGDANYVVTPNAKGTVSPSTIGGQRLLFGGRAGTQLYNYGVPHAPAHPPTRPPTQPPSRPPSCSATARLARCATQISRGAAMSMPWSETR